MAKKSYVVCFMCLFVFFQILLFPDDCPSNCASWRLVDIPENPYYYMWDVAKGRTAYNCCVWHAVGNYGRYWRFYEDSVTGEITYTTSIEFPNHARTIIYAGPLRFVVAGHGGFISIGNGLSGCDWWEQTSPVTTDLYAGVYNSDADKVVLVGLLGKVVTESPAGWIEVANAGTSPIWNITYGNGKYVLCNANGWVYTSTNLNSWNRGVNLDCGNAQTAVFGDGVYLIGGTTKTSIKQVVYRSTDTINWTQHIMPWNNNGDFVYDLVYTGSKFIGVASNRWIIESEDGITWTKKNSPAYPRIMLAIDYSCVDDDIMAVGGYDAIYSECTQ